MIKSQHDHEYMAALLDWYGRRTSHHPIRRRHLGMLHSRQCVSRIHRRLHYHRGRSCGRQPGTHGERPEQVGQLAVVQRLVHDGGKRLLVLCGGRGLLVVFVRVRHRDHIHRSLLNGLQVESAQ